MRAHAITMPVTHTMPAPGMPCREAGPGPDRQR